jgi:hypothetical protein
MCFGPVAVRGDCTVDRDDLLWKGKNQKKVGDGFVTCVNQFAPAGAQCNGLVPRQGRGDLAFQGPAPRDETEAFTVAVPWHGRRPQRPRRGDGRAGERGPAEDPLCRGPSRTYARRKGTSRTEEERWARAR